MEVVNILKVILEEGLMYGILAIGVYISYSILDFPDLSVDGTLPFGAIVTGVLILQGVNPWLCCLIAFLCGAAAGSLTGFLNVRLKIRPLLCGILTMTALLSINLVICMAGTGGSSIVSFFSQETVFTSFPATLIPVSVGGVGIRNLILILLIALLCKLLLDAFLKTKSGLLLRAAGDNEQYVTMLARHPGRSKIIGLAIGNGFAALAGSVIAQSKESASTSMGTGMVVLGLASVIIGLSLFRRVSFMRATTQVLIGTLVYKAALQIALTMGLPTEYRELLMAAIFAVALVGGRLLDKGKSRTGHGSFGKRRTGDAE